MPIQVLMPALSPTMEKGNLAKWHKKEGEAVKTPIAMILGEGEDASALTDGGGAARQQKAPVTGPAAKAEQPAPQVNHAPAPAKPQPAAPPPLPTPPEPDLPEGTEMV